MMKMKTLVILKVTNSAFDYAQLDLSDTDVVQKVKEKNTKT